MFTLCEKKFVNNTDNLIGYNVVFNDGSEWIPEYYSQIGLFKLVFKIENNLIYIDKQFVDYVYMFKFVNAIDTSIADTTTIWANLEGTYKFDGISVALTTNQKLIFDIVEEEDKDVDLSYLNDSYVLSAVMNTFISTNDALFPFPKNQLNGDLFNGCYMPELYADSILAKIKTLPLGICQKCNNVFMRHDNIMICDSCRII